MTKRNLTTGLILLILGACCLIVGIFTTTVFQNIFIGIASACLFHGMVKVFQYIYWHLPKNNARRHEILEAQSIEQHDELKTMLRDRAGHLCYFISLFFLGIIILGVAILNAIGVIVNAVPVFILLGLYLLLMVVAYPILYKALLKRF